ncbi:MAG TPA: hypothetical protein VG326_10255 [Tepidisphaeraceae bacterium]|jgi:hypothetical protein|nr:hypothetical protein [Tepidisphaeraceae bacterium]
MGVSAGAGSIFDDNWTPPKTADHPKIGPAPANTTAPTAPPSPSQPKTAPPGANQSAGVLPPELSAPVIVAKRPIPAKGDLTRSRKLLREAYGDLLKDRSFKARRSLVQTLLEESEKPGNSPSDQFALLAGAIDAAKEGESLRLCVTAADKIAELFDVDGLKLKTQAATTMVLKAPSPADTAENIRADLELADQLVAAEDFSGAARVVAIARPLAADNPEMRAQVLKRSQSIESARSAYDQIQPYLDKLKTSPSDEAANQSLANHYCFKLGQWDKGVAYLAKGSDAKLKELAKAELAATSDPADALTLAAGWWDRAEETGTSDADAKALKLHAATWYRFGQSAASGLAAKVVEIRLNQAVLLGFSGGSSPIMAAIAARPVGHAGPPGTVDLLRLIDLKKDAISGPWTMNAQELKCGISDKDEVSKIRFPYDPPAEYDVNIELTRLKQGHNGIVTFECPHAGDKYIIVVGDRGNRDTWISGSSDRDAVHTRLDATLPDDRKTKIRIEVRKEKISVYLNGTLSASCVVNPNQGDNGGFWWVGDHALGMGTWNAIVIHSMKVTEIGQSGSAMALGPATGIPALPIPAPADIPSRVVNLMPLIDVSRDANDGVWQKTANGGIMSTGGRCRIRIPYQPPEEYDFRVVFKRVNGDGWMGQIAWLGGKGVIWILAANSNNTSGFGQLAGRWIDNNSTTVRNNVILQNDRPYTSVVHVRRGRLSASVDGKLVADYKTNGSDMNLPGDWLVGENILGLASEGARVQFDAIEIHEIRGQGKTVAHVELPTLSKPPPDDTAQRTVDLMPLINPAVDTVGGRWYRVNKNAIASDGSQARLRIPYHPPEEYDFHVRVHRTGGGQYFAMIMSHGLHNFHWMMGGWDNRICGLELIDGRRADSNPTTVKSDSVFQTNRVMDIVGYVRNGSVAVSVDGKLVADFKTNYGNLTPLNETYIGDGALGLFSTSTSFQVDVIEIKEITGEGKPSPRGQ